MKIVEKEVNRLKIGLYKEEEGERRRRKRKKKRKKELKK